VTDGNMRSTLRHARILPIAPMRSSPGSPNSPTSSPNCPRDGDVVHGFVAAVYPTDHPVLARAVMIEVAAADDLRTNSIPRRLGRNYFRLFWASTISNLGDGIGLIAYPWLASAVTSDPLLIALVVVVQRLPWLLFSCPPA
jgi:hypothetical protein